MNPASKFVLAPPILATAFITLLAATAINEGFIMFFAGFVALIALLMAVPRHLTARCRQCWVICALILFSIAAFDWPLHLSYLTARPGLERLAQQLRAGQTIATPVRVGLIVIRGAELRRRVFNRPGLRDDPKATDIQDIACLWTDRDPSGFGGFVQCRPQYLQFNIFSHRRLDDRWQFIKED